jgi:TPR repeat protein
LGLSSSNSAWSQGNLEGGAYDLALAERFAPLDVQANSWRELARLYLFGSSFWEVMPEQAVYYFRKSLEMEPSADAHINLASALQPKANLQKPDTL